MPSPLGHSLAGYAVYGFSATAQNRDRLYLILLSVLMANAPDLDFLPGLLIGKPTLYHREITHSLGIAVFISVGVAGIYSLRGKSFSTIFHLCFFSYLSHLILDLFGPDGEMPLGLPLFWPISGEHFISPVQVFWGVRHAGSTASSASQWMKSLLNLHNLGTMALEIVLIAPFIFLGQRYRRGTMNDE
jgi:membrane-bound metal-dependent hydrolase YbcI (DUF457 family)